MVFLNLRQRADSVQALLTVTPEKVSKQMVKWATGLADESIVLVEGKVQKTPELIKSASVDDVEVHVAKVFYAGFLVNYRSHRRDCSFFSSPALTDAFHSLLMMRPALSPKWSLLRFNLIEYCSIPG